MSVDEYAEHHPLEKNLPYLIPDREKVSPKR
jgi:hypothetical protein